MVQKPALSPIMALARPRLHDFPGFGSGWQGQERLAKRQAPDILGPWISKACPLEFEFKASLQVQGLGFTGLGS